MNVQQQVLMNTTPSGNDGMMYISTTITVEYFTCIIKSNTIIYFGIQYLPNNKITMHQTMSDYNINKYNIPRDIIEYCIDNAPKNLKLIFGKNFVSLNSPYDAINALKTSFPKQLKQYVESKHSDYEVDIPKVLSRKVKIKKK